MKNDTELGKLAKSYMDKGELVPDDVTIAMVRDRLSRPDCKDGAILDGFPRTPVQADALGKMLAEFGGEVNCCAVHRGCRKPSWSSAQAVAGPARPRDIFIHEKFNPPKKAGVCDLDGSELYQREDDKAETVTRRIQVYFDPDGAADRLLPGARASWSEIDGTQSIEKVSADLLAVLGK